MKVVTSEHTIMYTVVVSDHIEKTTEALAEFLAPMIGVERAESPADTCPSKVVEVTPIVSEATRLDAPARGGEPLGKPIWASPSGRVP